MVAQEREDNWRIPPSNGIPKYSAEADAHCPAGQMKKYNDEKRLNAKLLAEKDQRNDKWARVSLENNFKDIPLKMNPSLRYKAMESLQNSKQEAAAEVEILQKIIVREGLLSELHKLLKSQNDVNGCMGEVIELIKAMRYQTLDIVEDISAWQDVQGVPRSFLFKGLNYLIKLKGDLDFLDIYDEITERFCFEFKSNPLAYRDGGNLITGYNFDRSEYNKALLNRSSGQTFVDGIEVVRLRNAEKIIQNEFNKLSAEKSAKEGGAIPNLAPEKMDNNNKGDSDDPLTKVSSSIERGGVISQRMAKAKSKKKGMKASATSADLSESAEPNDIKYYYEKTPKKNFNPRK